MLFQSDRRVNSGDGINAYRPYKKTGMHYILVGDKESFFSAERKIYVFVIGEKEQTGRYFAGFCRTYCLFYNV